MSSMNGEETREAFWATHDADTAPGNLKRKLEEEDQEEEKNKLLKRTKCGTAPKISMRDWDALIKLEADRDEREYGDSGKLRNPPSYMVQVCQQLHRAQYALLRPLWSSPQDEFKAWGYSKELMDILKRVFRVKGDATGDVTAMDKLIISKAIMEVKSIGEAITGVKMEGVHPPDEACYLDANHDEWARIYEGIKHF